MRGVRSFFEVDVQGLWSSVSAFGPREGVRIFEFLPASQSCKESVHLVVSSNTLPSGSRIKTSRPALPNEWEEQLRHGSKARMTISTLLSNPSLSFLPSRCFLATWVSALLYAVLQCSVAMIMLTQVVMPWLSTFYIPDLT